MSKKHFIALADFVRATRPGGFGNEHAEADPHYQGEHQQWEYMRDKLADFCAEQNPNFKRDRWLSYIAGECGKDGGRK